MEVVMKKLGLFLTLGLFSALQLQSSVSINYTDTAKRLETGCSTGIILGLFIPPKRPEAQMLEFLYPLKNASDIQKFWALAKEAFGDNLEAIILVPHAMAQKVFTAELTDYLKENLVIWNEKILDDYKNSHKNDGVCFVHILLSKYNNEHMKNFQELLSCIVAIDALRSLSGQK